MPEKLTVVLIDSKPRRYSTIAALLHQTGIAIRMHAYQSGAELGHAVIMIADDEGILNEVLDLVTLDRRLSLVVYAEEPDVRKIVNVISRGAADYLLVPTSALELKTTLARARRRANLITPAHHRVTQAAERIDRLTKREREVLLFIAKGLSNRLIAVELEISPRTVEVHRANMMSKLGAKSMSEAIRIAIQAGAA